MTHKEFTHRQLFTEAYALTKRHYWFLLGLLAINIIIGAVVNRIPVVSQIITLLLSVATTYILVSIVNSHKPLYEDMVYPLKHYRMPWHYFLAALIMLPFYILGAFFFAVSFIVGAVTGKVLVPLLICLLIPIAMVYYAARFGFFAYFIVEDETLGPITALKKSWHLTRGRSWELMGYVALFLLLNLLGLVLFVVGLLFTIPLTMLATTLLYRKWNHGAHHVPATEGH